MASEKNPHDTLSQSEELLAKSRKTLEEIDAILKKPTKEKRSPSSPQDDEQPSS